MQLLAKLSILPTIPGFLLLIVILPTVDAKLTRSRERFEKFDGRLPLALSDEREKFNWFSSSANHHYPNNELDAEQEEEQIARIAFARMRSSSDTVADKRGETMRKCGMLLVNAMTQLCGGCIAPPAGTERSAKRGQATMS
jgi:hypothetical protein